MIENERTIRAWARINRAAMHAELGAEGAGTIADAVTIHTAGLTEDELRGVLFRLTASMSAAIMLGGCDCECETCYPDE
ncbi:Uncharacterised protein [Mycobacteroides abscessus subsp. abscessus]|uniref:hypothetical protein n=1 Tax=Mycobacteroides abscessus TaxID=36809 RepID=UPI0009A6AB1B|nr:hypothetical protein [Mycobacteroides abscessus]SKD91830.1 Uncharacterised protein [Mycobacteroides abscessus subsp. abscessus]